MLIIIIQSANILGAWLLIPSGMTPEVVSAEGINSQVSLRCWLLIPSTMTPEEITEGGNDRRHQQPSTHRGSEHDHFPLCWLLIVLIKLLNYLTIMYM